MTPSNVQPPTSVFRMNNDEEITDLKPTIRTPVTSTATATTTSAMTAPGQGVWPTSFSQGMRPRPVTIHEGFSYCIGEAYDSMTSWDSSKAMSSQQTTNDAMSRPMSMHQEYYPTATMGDGDWAQKPCDDSLELQLDSDMTIGQAFTTDEAIPILDLRYSNGAPMEGETLNFDGGLNPRRLSGSSFTMSTSGALSDMPSYEDFSAALSDAPSFSSDFPPPSNRNSLMSSTQLSPVASPRMTPQGRSELVRTQSRGRASPSPRPGMRAAPYSVDGPRNKRWSTGSYSTIPNRRTSPFVFHGGMSGALGGGAGGGGGPSSGGSTGIGAAATVVVQEPFGPRLTTSVSSHSSSPIVGNGQLPLDMGNLQHLAVASTAANQPQNPFFLSANPQAAAAAVAVAAASGYGRHSMLLPTQLPSQAGSLSFHPSHQVDGMGGGLTGQQHYLPSSQHAMVGIGHGLHPHQIPSHHPHGHPGLPVGHPHYMHHQTGSSPYDSSPASLMSHGLFRMLQSNGDSHSLNGHYTDLSDPPDLYASLNEEQLPPPPEDMNPGDPDLVPHEQELRFKGDLYTPKWVRGHGNKREGWCGICKPGRWLVLKNSAFWYDKSFTHGISAATGNPFQEPQETRRMDGNPDVWEGLCGSCNDWIALVSSKKKGTTWFRHAYKCHTHPKIKDAPKRRRESNHNRLVGTTAHGVMQSLGSGVLSLAASNMSRPRIESPVAPMQQIGLQVQSQQHQQQQQYQHQSQSPQELQQKQQQDQQQQEQTSPSIAVVAPQTPLTPQMTPVVSSVSVSVGNATVNSGSSDSEYQTSVQITVPVSMEMAPSNEQLMLQQPQLQQRPQQIQTPDDSPQQAPMHHQEQQQQQQQQQQHHQHQHQHQHQNQHQQVQHLPPPHPPPSQPLPQPPGQLDQHRFQHQLAQMEAMQQHQLTLQHAHKPLPPPSPLSRPIMTTMDALMGNMI